MFNVGRALQWTFADGLGVNPKADLERIGLAILILRQVANPSLCLGTSRGFVDSELGGRCSHDLFYMHKSAVACMLVSAGASNPGPPVSIPKLCRLGYMAPSRLEFSVVFSKSRVNMGYNPLEKPP